MVKWNEGIRVDRVRHRCGHARPRRAISAREVALPSARSFEARPAHHGFSVPIMVRTAPRGGTALTLCWDTLSSAGTMVLRRCPAVPGVWARDAWDSGAATGHGGLTSRNGHAAIAPHK